MVFDFTFETLVKRVHFEITGGQLHLHAYNADGVCVASASQPVDDLATPPPAVDGA